MEIGPEDTATQRAKRLLSKTAIGTIIIALYAALLGWPLYNWLAS